MHNKDNVILESLYQSIYIKEAVFQLTQSKMLEDVLKKTSSANVAQTKYNLTDDDGTRLLNKWLQSCPDEASQVAQQAAGAIILVKDLTGNGEQVNITQKVKAVASKPIDIHSADTQGKDQNIKYKAAWIVQHKDLINKKTPYIIVLSGASSKKENIETEFQWLEQNIEEFVKLLHSEGYNAHIENDESSISMGVRDEYYLTDFYTAFRFIEFLASKIDKVTRKIATKPSILDYPYLRYSFEYKIKNTQILVTTRPDEEKNTEDDTIFKDEEVLDPGPNYSQEEDDKEVDEQYYLAFYWDAVNELKFQGVDFSNIDRDKARELIKNYLLNHPEHPLEPHEIEEDMLERAVNDSRLDAEDEEEDNGEFGDYFDDEE